MYLSTMPKQVSAKSVYNKSKDHLILPYSLSNVMNRHTHLIILLLICILNIRAFSQGQNSFVNEYIYPNKSSAGYGIIENSDSSFTVATYFADPGPGTYSDIGLFNCDQDGNINWGKSYTNSGHNQLYSFISLQHHGYLIAGRRMTAPSMAYILFLDTAGNLTKVLHPSNYYNMKAAYSAEDSSIYLFGSYNFLPQVNITKLDVNGNLIWSKIYTGAPSGGGTMNVTPDNGVIFSYLKSGSFFQGNFIH